MKARSLVLSTLLSLTITQTVVAESPIVGVPVKTKFSCNLSLAKQIGSDYNSVNKNFSIVIDTDFEEVVDIARIIKLPANLSGGFISFSSADYGDQKVARMAVRTPSYGANGLRIYSQESDTVSGQINGASLEATPSFTALDDSNTSKSYILNIGVTCDLEEM